MDEENFFDDARQSVRGVSIKNVHEERLIDRERLDQIVRHVVDEEDADLHYLGVILADHETVLELNRDYLEHDHITDVLSFPLRDTAEDARAVVDGEIYVDLDTAAERAPEFDTTYEQEVYRYVIHGLLHLIGYDDQSEEDLRTMREREERYLS